MLLILPPSETKRDGGVAESSLDLAALRFPELTRERRAALAALARVSRNATTAAAALKLGPTQRFEIDRNRSVRRSPVMPAIDRYTGVLYDALDAASLSASEREFAGRHVVVHSALFGLVGALDPIPAYRLSHDSRMPDLVLRRHWAAGVSARLAEHDGVVLDLRSEGYVALGPPPVRSDVAYVRVVTDAPDGTRKALNHFNKSGKGRFTRAVLESGIVHADLASLIEWAPSAGFRLAPSGAGVLDLVV